MYLHKCQNASRRGPGGPGGKDTGPQSTGSCVSPPVSSLSQGRLSSLIIHVPTTGLANLKVGNN